MVKPTESIEFHDSPGVSSLVLLLSLLLPLLTPWESLGDSVTLYRMHARIFFASRAFLERAARTIEINAFDHRRSIRRRTSFTGLYIFLGTQRAFARCLHSKEISDIRRLREGQQVFIVKKSVLPIVLYYHASSNNLLFCRFVVSRSSGLLDVSNCT